MEHLKSVRVHSTNKQLPCTYCHNRFAGKICNECGEKRFDAKQLSARHFVHQAVDLVTHFESKVLSSIWLLMRRPGLLTKENLRGVRVPYAKPVQLFIITNVLFFMVVNYLHRTDYTPSASDTASSKISDRPGLHWLAGVEVAVLSQIDSLRTHKLQDFNPAQENSTSYKTYTESRYPARANERESTDKTYRFFSTYDYKVGIFSKTLLFLLIPVLAGLFYLLFYKKLKYYGAALILATHFLTFNLLFYSVLMLVSHLPKKVSGLAWAWGLPFKFMERVFYADAVNGFSTAVFGLYGGFEALHILFLGAWLFFAFRRLFGLHWIVNMLLSYLLARLTFVLIFSIFKKALIAFTLWNL